MPIQRTILLLNGQREVGPTDLQRQLKQIPRNLPTGPCKGKATWWKLNKKCKNIKSKQAEIKKIYKFLKR